MLGVSVGTIRPSRTADAHEQPAEPRKLTASSRMAYGAVTAPMSPPASPGPASAAAERLISSFELPSTSWPRSTSEGRYDW